jgi:predicted transcriptional regulator
MKNPLKESLMKRTLVATRLQEQTLDRLQRIATEEERTLAYLLRKATEEFVNRKGGKRSRTKSV